ncbi:MAG: carbohydrate ABC transporter permease [Anaerolineae bacterium]|nr:carbohydrate ABC transporter permease [Anaerolineae bacterium]
MRPTEFTNPSTGPTLTASNRQLGSLSFTARDVPVYIVLLIFLLIAIFPFIIMIFTSFKTSSELARGAFSLPEVWRWANFVDAWTQARFDRFFLSSVIVSIPVVLISTALSIMSGYAFGRMVFPFSRALFFILLLGLMVPLEALIIPLYHNLRWIGLLDTYWALILPQIGMSVSFGTFWMRGFFAEVPQDLVDAATVDGCNSWDTLWRVLLPTAQPAITSMMVLFFVWTWNDFLLALVLISTENLRTLPLGLAFFQGQHTTNVPLVAAGATIVAIPAIMMYIAFQRQFIRGITGGSVQG